MEDKDTDFEPAGFEVSLGLGPLPPIFVPLSPGAEQWRPSAMAWHAVIRIVGWLRANALAHPADHELDARR